MSYSMSGSSLAAVGGRPDAEAEVYTCWHLGPQGRRIASRHRACARRRRPGRRPAPGAPLLPPSVRQLWSSSVCHTACLAAMGQQLGSSLCHAACLAAVGQQFGSSLYHTACLAVVGQQLGAGPILQLRCAAPAPELLRPLPSTKPAPAVGVLGAAPPQVHHSLFVRQQWAAVYCQIACLATVRRQWAAVWQQSSVRCSHACLYCAAVGSSECQARSCS